MVIVTTLFVAVLTGATKTWITVCLDFGPSEFFFFLITYMHPLFYIHEVRLLWLSTVKVVCNVF
jgi:hypothetical protein